VGSRANQQRQWVVLQQMNNARRWECKHADLFGCKCSDIGRVAIEQRRAMIARSRRMRRDWRTRQLTSQVFPMRHRRDSAGSGAATTRKAYAGSHTPTPLLGGKKRPEELAVLRDVAARSRSREKKSQYIPRGSRRQTRRITGLEQG